MHATELMKGFPPERAGQVTLANWRKPPFNKWSFHHVREIVPSANIGNDPSDIWDLPRAPGDLGSTPLMIDGAARSFASFLSDTDTDALVVLHRGRIIYDYYKPGMDRDTPHILMSVSKSMLGLLAGILVEQGTLDPEALVTSIIPEVEGTAYDGATLRDLLDMRAGIQFDENYLASSGAIIEYRKAQGWDPYGLGETPSDLRSFYSALSERDGRHGGAFHYVSPNTDLLGWVIERRAGRRFADLMSDLVWKPLGSGNNAYITVDRLGAPRCAGGMCTTAEDLARVGELLVRNGRRGSSQILPQAWLSDIVSGGDRDAWDKGDFAGYLPGLPVRYRSKWYTLDGPAPMTFGIGVFGQNLFVDPTNEIVIAKFSSHALPMDNERIMLTMKGIEAIRCGLVA
ncbi:serine hydrolase [Aestuariivirga sp.]|uniref:serine hydrolase domain-containing protein n=1 Tax=Aestuariivirga sp. TaxID=2650926 RepID=UPI0030194ECD